MVLSSSLSNFLCWSIFSSRESSSCRAFWSGMFSPWFPCWDEESAIMVNGVGGRSWFIDWFICDFLNTLIEWTPSIASSCCLLSCSGSIFTGCCWLGWVYFWEEGFWDFWFWWIKMGAHSFVTNYLLPWNRNHFLCVLIVNHTHRPLPYIVTPRRFARPFMFRSFHWWVLKRAPEDF